MKKFMIKMTTVLKMGITIMLMMVCFVDGDFLNSMIIQSDVNDLVVEEVMTVAKKTNTQLAAQVMVNEDDSSNSEEDVENTSLNNEEKSEAKVVITDEEVVDSYVTTVSVSESKNWVWPTNSNYIITSYYGYRWGSLHEAVDISGAGYGSSIYAANSGVVTTVKGGCVAGNMSCNGRGGNYIVIKHNTNNYYTIYMHLKDIYVSKGQSVSRGQVIGTMGNTGNVSPAPSSSNPYAGTHLHFGLYVGEPYNGGYSINPMSLY